MRILSRLTWVTWSLAATMLGCSGTAGTSQPGSGTSGGMLGQGGSAATGGSAALGGSSQATGGSSNGVGGMASGGSGTPTGGAMPTGGSKATGGSASATGGANASGGANATGGNKATGGSNSATGGTNATGGSKATGGGSSATGGTNATGGSKATGGGSSGTGGALGTGGTTSAGGAASFKCDNLTMAPSTTGQTKPGGAVGGMKVLDWAGFTGAVSFTFDDNTPSQMSNYTALKATGAHFTWFVVGTWLNGSSSTISQYKGTLSDGQEIANHTYSHQSAGSQSDLQQNETFITQNFGVTASSMAAPNCDQSWSSVAPSVLFQNRGPCGNYGAGQSLVAPRDSTNAFLLPAYLPNSNEASSTMDTKVNDAKSAGKWRIFVIHGFDSQNGTYQPVPIGNVTTTMSNAVKNGLWAETITNVGAYWQGQKLISASATTSATWTLPAHFPTNMCLRITTTGGTVMQGGKSVPWDDHGYYQISLDAGSVTIQ